MKIAKDKIETQLGKYIRGKPDTITDNRILRIVDDYKKNFARKLTPLTPYTLSSLKSNTSKWNLGEKLHVSIKVDGETVLFVYDEKDSEEKAYFCNATAHRVWTGLPALQELEELMKENNITKAIIPGELYATHDYPPNFEERSYVYDLTHYNRQPDSEKDLERLGFRAFDIIQINQDDQWLKKDYSKRFKKLKIIFPPTGRCAVVKTQVMAEHELHSHFEDVVMEKGHEGIVIRNAVTFQGYKVKPIHSIDCVIVGVVEGQLGSKVSDNQLSSCIVALRYPNGVYHVLTRVGGGLTDEKRTELWAYFKKNFAPAVGFFMPTKDGRAFRMVKPQKVAQINYMDVTTHTVGNAPIMQNTMRFNEDSNSWEILQPAPFISLISPRFVKDNPIREDKTPDSLDVRINQITDIITIEMQEIKDKVDLPKSDKIARYVFSKESKVPGINMVRKVVAWKTNKKNIDPSYPNFVIFHTDYSPGRKNELQRKVKIAESENQMWKIFESIVRKNVLNKKKDAYKKGWSLFDRKDERKKPLELPKE